MNKVLIVDASDSDRRLMSGLLVKSGYEPIAVECMEAAKDNDSATPPEEKLIDRPSDEFKKVKEKIAWLATSNANIIIFCESGMSLHATLSAMMRY